MSQPVRFLLLSNDIRDQLKKHTCKVLESWTARWELFKNRSWDIKIDSSLNGIECKSLEVGVKANKQLLFSIGVPRNKHMLASEIAQEKTATVNNSKLVDSIIADALSELQSDYVGEKLLAQQVIIKSEECQELLAHVKSNNITVVTLSTDGFQMIFLLSMSLIGALVEEPVVDHNQPPLTTADPSSSYSDELVKLKFAYGSVDVSVEELSTIRIGDVICLDKPISSSMSVSDRHGNHLFSGYLGFKENNLALKVAKK